MPDVEVMDNVFQNLFHVAGNWYMAVRDKSLLSAAHNQLDTAYTVWSLRIP